MKNRIKKWIDTIKAFVKKNYIACTVVGSLILVIILSLIIVGLIKSFKNKIEVTTENASFYQYFDISKTDFDAKISMEDNKIVNVSSKTYKLFKETPVYYTNKDALIIPKESMIVFYYRENLTYRLPKYSKMTLESGSCFINSNGKEIPSYAFFIFDGEDTYIIPNQSLLKINGDAIALGELSYIIANANTITYYDNQNKVANRVDNITNATLYIEDYTIDLLKDTTVYNSKVSLLRSELDSMKVYVEE